MEYTVSGKTKYSVSVRELVEFILRSGDVDRRASGKNRLEAMQEGSRVHRVIQGESGASYHPEVGLSHTLDMEEYALTIEGRADGIIEPEDGALYTIDEIKCTYRDVHAMEEPVPVHLAQAKCYAYIFAMDEGLSRIIIRMTYVQIKRNKRSTFSKKDIRLFETEYSFDELEGWFGDIISEYRKWSDMRHSWSMKRNESIRSLSFPFAYRNGQRKLMSDVYTTICGGKKLFLMAPTGTGKTIATLFPAIKAIGEEKSGGIFYLTAKTVTGAVAADTLELLKRGGLSVKYITITARQKQCPMDRCECNPEACPRAKGHFDRVNEALFAALNDTDAFTMETVADISERYELCPYELSLDIALRADCVICDYNYAFDPFVCLQRFFGPGKKGDHVFLIDEAHNLVQRARDMYSASLSYKAQPPVRKILKDKPGAKKCVRSLSKLQKSLRDLKETVGISDGERGYAPVKDMGDVVSSVVLLYSLLDEYLLEHTAFEGRDEVLQYFFTLNRFLTIESICDDSYAVYADNDSAGSFRVNMLCVNPAANLEERLRKAIGSVLFSATLLPVNYFKDLLSVRDDDYAVYAETSFDKSLSLVAIAKGVTSKYTERGASQYALAAKYIKVMTDARCGNYMAFFPSYKLLEAVCKEYKKLSPDVRVICQEPDMDSASRREFLSRFEPGREKADKGTLVGFCVTGGIYGEGIDLTGERLIGVAIYGTGLPMVNTRQEILKEYYDGCGMDGFDYAYRFPGFVRTLQAAGRVVRTASDRGVILLMDERFLQNEYRRLFPRQWEDFVAGDLEELSALIRGFWSGA